MTPRLARKTVAFYDSDPLRCKRLYLACFVLGPLNTKCSVFTSHVINTGSRVLGGVMDTIHGGVVDCQPQRARLNHGLRDAQNVCALTKVGTVLKYTYHSMN